MKKFIFFFLLFNIFSNETNAEIVYIDINLILKKSNVGRSLNLYLDEENNKHSKKYKEIEQKLIDKEKILISQQNILDENEFKNKLDALSVDVKKFRYDRKLTFDELKKIKLENTKKILNFLNPIIADYVEKNSINLVLTKKNIVVGKKNLDITDKIITILNSKVKDLNF